ncbi:unnamed protein product [Symbiodinium necroappetens]|uniref:Uncharacterized protein n=1 Tax=Symbiodinium necroappetens TaxID=1628268 RepID=A0A812L8Q2_9DINO|nr:unnamed protein product [Symbiodinium necroappetens]
MVSLRAERDGLPAQDTAQGRARAHISCKLPNSCCRLPAENRKVAGDARNFLRHSHARIASGRTSGGYSQGQCNSHRLRPAGDAFEGLANVEQIIIYDTDHVGESDGDEDGRHAVTWRRRAWLRLLCDLCVNLCKCKPCLRI